jgi:hypothetical protein
MVTESVERPISQNSGRKKPVRDVQGRQFALVTSLEIVS